MKKKNGKKHTLRNITIISSAALAVFTAAGWPFFYFMTVAGKKKPQKTTEENKKLQKPQSANKKKWFALQHTTLNHPNNGYAEEYEKGRAWCESREMKDYYIQSRDGLRLHASYLPVKNAERIVILCHGYRASKFGTVAYPAEFLHDEKCDILFIDQRCCGESEGKIITFGAKEQYDILEWVSHMGAKNEKGLPIYLFGQSMGAASVLLAAGHKLPADVHGIIADCGYHSMKQQLRDIAAGWFHLKHIGLLLFRVDIFCRLLGKFSMKETDTTAALQTNRLPVLFFHGELDTYVWPENSKRNYELCCAEKELVLVPEARHSCSSYVAPELYKEKLKEFFKKYDKPSA